MKRLLGSYLLGAVLVVAIIMIVKLAHSTAGFPPISVIAQQLNIAAGRPLPKGVVWNGRPWFFYVISASQSANGDYNVRLRAR
jgi:hypothetical protein